MNSDQIMNLHDAFWPLANEIGGATEMNGHAFAHLAAKLAASGRPVEELTLGEVTAMIEATSEEYNALYRQSEEG